MESTQAPTILIGIGGGIAAYKTAAVVSDLVQSGLDVHVAMTPSACRFITPLTFAALTGHPVLDSLFPTPSPRSREEVFPHLYPATLARLCAIMPATAGTIAKLAHGLSMDTVSCSALSLPPSCLRFFCPAMNVEMWEQAVVRANVARLEAMGWRAIGPEKGHLACGMEGSGRMSEPSVIADVLRDALKGWNSLSGKTLLIFSGPTHEPLDPVRYLSNHSSGKMGQALAEVALDQGASVHLVTGPVDTARLPRGRRLEITQVHRAAEMLAEGRKHFKKADGVIFAAAVADFAPRETASDKAPKKQGKLSLDLKLNPDIAKTLCASKNPRQKVFGFALETGRGLASATRKLKEKHLDGIVLNGPETFGADFGDYQMILAGGKTEVRDLGRLTKRQLARHILKVMFPPAK